MFKFSWRKLFLYFSLLVVTAFAVACAQNGTDVAGGDAPANGDTPAAQVGCSRPDTMDERFCDEDGDLIADPPTDPSEFVNPDTLVFAYTPVEDPAVYEDVWADFIEHMEEVTGKNVEFFAVDSNAAQLEALRAGRLHVAGVNTGGVPFAVNLAGFRPFAIMAAADGSFGYEMEIITRVDSDIQVLDDLAGRQLAFTSPTSNSGFQAPSALLEGEAGLVADRDFQTAFSGAHDNSILGVKNGDFEAAAIANSVKNRMCARGAADCDQLRTIYTSETFPTTGYGYVYNLDPELAELVKEAFFTFDWSGTGLEAEFGGSDDEPGEAQFIEITYQEYWQVIREINEIQGVEYTLS
ncbi:phosphate/phosphite/phosphonate ABC transporter substrate-binding protein [Leptolyngbya sp. KIOST-1]|uniref:phosphate/phosphite/phosphonate ABC transporter substrate-binding protein n=1 Tax=Leptolyngbya sp. KIOST-1 TaxID=1229172 RepID=UPI000907B947|nr:phosphate/phosphite/phosphonate ABC transporter substrate-binding protein [Leptolyngbya sp. KIOST-1]